MTLPRRLFPDRFLENAELGAQMREQVTRHAQLVQFLQRKAGGRQMRLPFEGMNVVVYRQTPGP